MALFQSQVVLPFFTGLQTDVIVNRFHWTSEEALPAVSAAAATRLGTLYTSIYSGTAGSRVGYVDWPLAVVKTFDLSDPPPRVPDILQLGTFSAGTGTAQIPTEVAVVASWHAAPESGVRFQRLYNRIFLGAVPTAWLTASAVDAFPTVSSAQRTTIANAFAALLSANTSDPGVQWVQVSNAGALTVAREITGGWIDNSPDTQRRRSVLASARTTWV